MAKSLARPARSVALVGLLVGSAVLGAVAIPLDLGNAQLVPPASSDSWAFGVDRWFNLTVDTPHGVHSISAHFEWYAVFGRTNVSSHVTNLEIEDWALSDFTARYCSPNCSGPTVDVLLHHATYQRTLGELNLTNSGVVYEAGIAVPAIAILNTSASLSGWTKSSSLVSLVTPGIAQRVSEVFSAAVEARADLALAPALGLAPLNLSVGTAWNASSVYTGSADWAVNWSYSKTNASGEIVNVSGNPSASLDSTGTVSSTGVVSGTLALPNGTVLPSISLNVGDPFELLDGALLLPLDGGFLDDSHGPWDSYQMGSASVAGLKVGIDLGWGLGRFQLLTASAFYSTNDTAVNRGETDLDGFGGNQPTAFGSSPNGYGIPATEVVASPMSVASARSAAACLTEGVCTVPAPADYLVRVLVVAAVGAVAAAGVLYWGRRTRTHRS